MQRQWGLLFREQLLRAGVTPAAIDKRLARGQLVAAQQCVYRMPGGMWDPRQAVLAAAMRAGGYATGWSALGLHGLLDLDGRRPPRWAHQPRAPP